MEKMPNFRLIELMVTIVDRGRGAKVVDLYRTEHLHFNYMCLGMGTANSEILDYFGLSETEKDIILTMIPDCKIPDLIQKASGALSSPGRARESCLRCRFQASAVRCSGCCANRNISLKILR